MLPNLISITIFSLIIQSKYSSFDIFLLFLLPLMLFSINSQSIGYLLAITCGRNTLLVFIIISALIFSYCGLFTKENDLFVLVKYLTKLNPGKQMFFRIITYLYGFDMCPSGQTSALMTYMGWTDDLYNESLYLMIFQSIFFTTLAYICLKVRTFRWN